MLDCLQIGKHYETIMNDILLFTLTKNHNGKIRRFVKGFNQEWIENITSAF